MSWRDIQDRAIVSMSIVLGILACVAFVVLLGYLALQGWACVQEWRMPESFIEFFGVLTLLKLVVECVWLCIWLLK